MTSIEALRIRLDAGLRRREAEILKLLITEYRKIYTESFSELANVISKVERARAQGQDISEAWLIRETQLRVILIKLERDLKGFTDLLKDRVERQKEQLITQGVLDATNLILAGYPPNQHDFVREAFMSGYNENAVMEQVARLLDGSPVLRAIERIAPKGVLDIRTSLISGVARGLSPREVAAEIKRKFDIPIQDSIRIARTEMLTSYRTANIESYKANSDVVQGYERLSAHDHRVCIACMCLDGKRYPLTEPFYYHPNCRCTAIPVTLSWAELGIPGIDESEPRLSGEAYFDTLPIERQIQMLGQRGYGMWSSGEVSLEDFAWIYDHPDYGRVMQRSTIEQALINAGKR